MRETTTTEEQAEHAVKGEGDQPRDSSKGGLRRRPGRGSLGRITIVLLGVMLGGGLLWKMSGSAPGEQAAQAQPAVRDVPYMEDDLIRFSPQFAKHVGLRFDKAEEREISPVVEVTATASLDPRTVALVGARISGRVRSVYKYEGDRVRAGEVLAELESAELGRAQAEVLKLRARESAALADEKRELALAEAKISSAREAELAKAAAVAARAERVAAEQAVRALGGDVEGPEVGVLRLKSPIAGKIISSSLARGQMVDPQMTAFQVANLEKLWMELAVYEQDVGAVRVGDKVELIPLAGQKDVVHGVVAHVGDTIDVDSRSARVRVEVPNPDLRLRPGQGLRARIVATGPKARWLTIPTDAVCRIDGKTTVFVKKNDQAVELRYVTLGPQSRHDTAVVAGLEAGESVVTKGVFALKSELFR